MIKKHTKYVKSLFDMFLKGENNNISNPGNTKTHS